MSADRTSGVVDADGETDGQNPRLTKPALRNGQEPAESLYEPTQGEIPDPVR